MKILCLGDNNVDIYEDLGVVFPGGNTYNVAVYTTMNGCRSAWLGAVGNDQNGRLQIDALKHFDIDASRHRVYQGQTAWAKVSIVNGDRIFMENYLEDEKQNPIILDSSDMEYIRSFDLVHSSAYSYLKADTLKKVRETGRKISYDFSVEWNEEVLRTICPHLDFGFLSLGSRKESEARDILYLAYNCGCDIVVGTMGKRGSLLYDGKNFLRQKAYLVPSRDELGAGDSFISKFLQCCLDGMLFRKSTEREAGITFESSDMDDYQEKLLCHSLSLAAVFSARTCMTSGAFDYSVKL